MLRTRGASQPAIAMPMVTDPAEYVHESDAAPGARPDDRPDGVGERTVVGEHRLEDLVGEGTGDEDRKG